MRGAANSNNIRDHLRLALQKVTIDHQRTVAKAVQARLTGVERLLALSNVGYLKGPSSGEEEPSWPGLTYMNDRIKKALADLPKYEDRLYIRISFPGRNHYSASRSFTS